MKPTPVTTYNGYAQDAHTIYFYWQPPLSSDHLPLRYRIQYRINGNGSWVLVGNTTQTGLFIRNLIPATNYALFVTPYTSAGDGKIAGPLSITTPPAGSLEHLLLLVRLIAVFSLVVPAAPPGIPTVVSSSLSDA